MKDNKILKDNLDQHVVDDFGREWKAFNQRSFIGQNLENEFNLYFNIFPFENLGKASVGFDMGCGSGRWAKLIAPRVGILNCIDPSAAALEQAKINLAGNANCSFECASVASSGLQDNSQDFGYSLGVLHHIPDTPAGLISCAHKLKKGAPFLLYLDYRFENKPAWYAMIWRCSDIVRRLVSRLPFLIKLIISQIIAVLVYLPLAVISKLLEKMGFDVSNIPLSDYRHKTFYFIRTDALDRFGTRLEKRFTKNEILELMHDAGFEDVKFSDGRPYWVCVGTKI